MIGPTLFPGAPAGYPYHRVVEEELPDGTVVRLRPLLPTDGPTLRDGMARLSDRTRWLRFHSPRADLSDRDLATLLDIDHVDREAIVAEVLGDGGPAYVGVARYWRTGEGEAELAVVIEDAWQGHGIGRLLLRHLADAALDNGIVRLTAEVLSSNDVMMRLLRKLGPAFECELVGNEYHTVSWLVPPERADDGWSEA